MNRTKFIPIAMILLLVAATLVLIPEVLAQASSGDLDISQLQCEYLVNPMGIDAANPRLSWTLQSRLRGERQTAYRILVASSPEILEQNRGDLWDTGKVPSGQTTQIAYQGRPLVSREYCYWRVRVWVQAGRGGWSQTGQWEMGLLKPGDWTARWISAVPPASNSTNLLIVRCAIYGVTDSTGRVDVTPTVVQHVDNNRLVMGVDNKTFGVDPAYGQPKELRVEYEWNGQSNTVEVNEGQTLMIPPGSMPVPYLRKDFELTQPVQRAVLYVAAMGLYQVDINGHRVGDHAFAPDWTDFHKRVRYQAYDVTALVQPGDNAMAAVLTNGWYSGHIGNGGYQLYGKVPAFLAQLEVTGADGSTKTIVTDASWKSHPSPILSSDIMMGEDYDARREVKGWDESGLDEAAWIPVQVRNEPSTTLCSQLMQPVRELCELKPKQITEPQPGKWIYDLGQNMVGVARLKVSAPAGTEVTLRQGEMLNPNGTLYTKNLRGARATDRYICKGNGTETWQPRFTYHRFRYVEVAGLTTNPGPGAVTGIVIGADTPHTGDFTCSDPRVNQLESNIQWSQRGNYFSVPTDCPQRNERLGWMGDAEVFIPTATYNANVAAFFTKWLVDVDDAQSPDGAFRSEERRVGNEGWTGDWSSDVCSSDLNQLESNIQWSQRGNYFSVPTDCPQRNERLGWMGDAEVFIPTATYNANVAAFFTKWLVDVDDAQSPDGAF